MAEIFVLPKTGVNMVEATIVEWNVKVGDTINKDDIIVSVETDKAVQEIPSLITGTILAILEESGETIQCQEPIAIIGEADEDINKLLNNLNKEKSAAGESAVPQAAVQAPSAAVNQAAVPGSVTGTRIRISPLAKKLARQNGINPLSLYPATPGGRIVSKDVIKFLSGQKPVVSTGAEQRIPLTGIRRAIANKMSSSNQNVPGASLTLSVDATEILKWKAAAKDRGVKIGITGIIIKTLSKVLKEHPMMNARLEGNEYVLNSGVNISVAVDTVRGLLVPVIKNAEAMTAGEISAELRTLAAKGRAGSLSVDEMSGGSFTITNLGMLGIEEFVPVVNYPECGILGVGAVKQKVVVADDGSFAAKPIFKMSLVFDHRIIDGAPAGVFLADLKKILEWPLGLI